MTQKQQMVVAYVGNHPGTSIPNCAHQTGVSASTVRRVSLMDPLVRVRKGRFIFLYLAVKSEPTSIPEVRIINTPTKRPAPAPAEVRKSPKVQELERQLKKAQRELNAAQRKLSETRKKLRAVKHEAYADQIIANERVQQAEETAEKRVLAVQAKTHGNRLPSILGY